MDSNESAKCAQSKRNVKYTHNKKKKHDKTRGIESKTKTLKLKSWREKKSKSRETNYSDDF
jgi:hypothetical protein